MFAHWLQQAVRGFGKDITHTHTYTKGSSSSSSGSCVCVCSSFINATSILTVPRHCSSSSSNDLVVAVQVGRRERKRIKRCHWNEGRSGHGASCVPLLIINGGHLFSLPFYPLITPSTFYFLSFSTVYLAFFPSEKIIFQIKRRRVIEVSVHDTHTNKRSWFFLFFLSYFPLFFFFPLKNHMRHAGESMALDVALALVNERNKRGEWRGEWRGGSITSVGLG